VERTGDRLRLVRVGGDRVASTETDRLTLLVDGVPVRRIASPFTVGEALLVEDVDSGTVLTLRWQWRQRRVALVRFDVERTR
jgi:hypothetical protein